MFRSSRLTNVMGKHSTAGYPDQATQYVCVAFQELAMAKHVGKPGTNYGYSVKSR